MSWTLSVIIICCLLAVFTLWLEYRRNNKNRLGWRMVATLLAVVALACILLPVTYNGKIKAAGDNEATLLTENYSIDSINKYNFKTVFTIDKTIKKSYPKAVLLTGLEDINTFNPAIKQLHVLGYGLDETELGQLHNISVVYNPPPAPNGIVAINWQQQLKTGDQLQVQGRYNNTSSKAIKLVLKGLNTLADSADLPIGRLSDFELTTTPKITGHATYTLLAISGGDTLKKESIPVIIEHAKPVKVLMLSASPDFESKFLKNWLGQSNYAVAVRATISKDKTSQDFVNMEKQSLDVLSPALLNKFDVVIGDLSTLKSLNTAESNTLKQQVQNGLGLVIRADSSGKASSWLENTFRVNTLSSKTVSVPLLLQNIKLKTAQLNIDPTYIADNNNLQNLVFDLQHHILAASTISGEGKLVFTTLRTTYTWMLAGNSKDYTALWSLLIGKAARKLSPASSWTTAAGIAPVNEPAQLQLQSATLPQQLLINDGKIPITEDPSVPYEWNAAYWPANIGWQRAITSNMTPSWLYIYQKNDWNDIKNVKKIADTKKISDNRGIILPVTKQMQPQAPVEVPKMYFYLILLAACTFLWVERKLIV